MLQRDTDPFEDTKLVLDRACEHIREFRDGINAFLNGESLSVKIEAEVLTGEYVYRVILASQPNARLKAVARDAFGGLRSTLDHLNSACMRIGGVASRTRGNSFPFAGSAAEMDRQISIRSPQVATAVTDYWKSLRPYPGGDDTLYALASIRNGKEHWRLRGALYTVLYAQVTFTNFTPWQHKIVDVNSTPGAITVVELFRSRWRNVGYSLESLIRLTFEDFGAFAHDDAVGFLQRSERKIRDIVEETEAIHRHRGLL